MGREEKEFFWRICFFRWYFRYKKSTKIYGHSITPPPPPIYRTAFIKENKACLFSYSKSIKCDCKVAHVFKWNESVCMHVCAGSVEVSRETVKVAKAAETELWNPYPISEGNREIFQNLCCLETFECQRNYTISLWYFQFSVASSSSKFCVSFWEL